MTILNEIYELSYLHFIFSLKAPVLVNEFIEAQRLQQNDPQRSVRAIDTTDNRADPRFVIHFFSFLLIDGDFERYDTLAQSLLSLYGK